MFVPSGNAEEFCDHVFRTFDMDKNGYIDFKVSSVSFFARRELTQIVVMRRVMTTVLPVKFPKGMHASRGVILVARRSFRAIKRDRPRQNPTV